MAKRNDALKDRLSRYRELNISVTGRKSGRSISNPVWFVLDDDNLYLLPVRGSDTQWYKNVLKNPIMRVDARAQRPRSRLFLSLRPNKCRPWSRNSATSTGPAT